jgi:hypothetical protein
MKWRPPARGSMLVLVLVAFLSAAVPAQAAVTVNTGADSGAAGGCMGLPGDCSLRQAVAKAEPGEAVVVPAGTYTLTLDWIKVTKGIAIEGANADSTQVVADGPIHAFVVESAAPATISGMSITAGHVTSGPEISSFLHGGAVYNTGGSSLTLDRVSVSGTTLETTEAFPGAIRGAGIANNGTLAISGSTISGNVERAAGAPYGSQGAGLFNSGGSVSILNSTIAGNSQGASSGASSSGSGIENVIDSAIALTNVTVAGNSGSAAIRNSDTVKAVNTIVANGTSGNCAGTTLTSLGHNLESADDCGFHAGGDQAGKDPLLTALAGNGGATATLPLREGSPAIDAADQAFCPATDQRGVVRPQRSGCDVGAFELEPASAAAPTSSAFRFGKLKRNKRRGTATLTVIVPGPGTLALGGRKVRPQSTSETKLLIRARGKAKRRLARKGRVKVRVRVTYTPTGGMPASMARNVQLIKLR